MQCSIQVAHSTCRSYQIVKITLLVRYFPLLKALTEKYLLDGSEFGAQRKMEGKEGGKVINPPETLLRRVGPLDCVPSRRTLHEQLGDQAFVIDNFLSPEECGHFIQECEREGFESLEAVFPHRYRSNDRIISFSHPVADSLFRRVRPFLCPAGNNYPPNTEKWPNTLMLQKDLQWQPMGSGGDGLWLPSALNECIKFGRYRPGCHFSPHVDGPWAPSPDRQRFLPPASPSELQPSLLMGYQVVNLTP